MSAAPGLPEGYGLRRYAEIDSTNEEARRLGEAGSRAPLWIVAERQTAGRGRRGRSWVSPSGNFMGTLLLRPRCCPRKAAELSFVAALAVHEAVEALLPPPLRPALKLKWPNDLLHEGRKLAGILLESSSTAGEEVGWLAIGIGINLAHHPEHVDYPAVSLAALVDVPPAPEVALATLGLAFDHRYRQWQRETGFIEIREAWLARAEGLGREVTVRLPDETLEGRFSGLAEDGALELSLADGSLRRVAAGDVFFACPRR